MQQATCGFRLSRPWWPQSIVLVSFQQQKMRSQQRLLDYPAPYNFRRSAAPIHLCYACRDCLGADEKVCLASFL